MNFKSALKTKTSTRGCGLTPVFHIVDNFKKIRHLLEYGTFLLFSFLIPFLTQRQLFTLSRILGKLAYQLMPCRRAVAETNIAIAFPETRDRAKVRSIIINSFGNVALGVLYVLWLKTITKEAIDSLVAVDEKSLRHMREAFAKNKGVLVLVGHFGNWELMGLSYGYNDLPSLNSIARKLDNRYLEERLNRFRTINGNKVIHKVDATKEILRALKRNECVAILMDQNVVKHEIYVDFFGKKAATTRALATLALSRGAPIVAAVSFTLPMGLYRTVYYPILPEITGDRKKDIVTLTRKCTRFMEERIRECPEGWMWGHRRWKKRPKGEPKIYGPSGVHV